MAKEKNAERAQRATYASDNRNGGYMIRVEGPNSARFVGRVVPVTTRNGDEHMETLERLIWAGTDKETGKPVALYKFNSKPRDEAMEDEIPF